MTTRGLRSHTSMPNREARKKKEGKDEDEGSRAKQAGITDGRGEEGRKE